MFPDYMVRVSTCKKLGFQNFQKWGCGLKGFVAVLDDTCSFCTDNVNFGSGGCEDVQ